MYRAAFGGDNGVENLVKETQKCVYIYIYIGRHAAAIKVSKIGRENRARGARHVARKTQEARHGSKR